MNLKIKKRCILCIALIISTLFFGGCSKMNSLFDIAVNNLKTSKNLPEYTLNTESFDEVTYDSKTYKITEDSVNKNKLDKPIGKVNQTVTIDENNKMIEKDELRKIHLLPKVENEKRTHLSFGWVYSIKNTDSKTEIAIVVNEKYRKAIIKE